MLRVWVLRVLLIVIVFIDIDKGRDARDGNELRVMSWEAPSLVGVKPKRQ